MDSPEWVTDIEGKFPLHRAVLKGRRLSAHGRPGLRSGFTAMPQGTKVISAESWGISAWTKTAKIEVSLVDGTSKRYFLKVRITSSINSTSPSEIGWEQSAR